MKDSSRGLIHRALLVVLYPWISRVRRLQGDMRELKQLEEQAQLVFVGNAASFLDFLVINDQLKRNGLKQISFAHGFNPFVMLPFAKACRIFFDRLFKSKETRHTMDLRALAKETAEGGHGYIFLKRARRLGPRVSYFTGYFGKIALDPRRQHKTCLVPTSVFLTRMRKSNAPRTMYDIFFGTYDIPGRWRKFFQLMFNFNKGGTVFGKHIHLDEALEKQGEQRPSEAGVEKRLRLALLIHLNKEDRAYRGPNKRSRGRKVRKILKGRVLNEELKQVAVQTNRSQESVMREASKILFEIASDTSERVINAMRILFDFIWARTLEGIDFRQEDIDKLRQLNKAGPVVILPCHRSHVDYLLVCYLFEKQGLKYPRIAAGDNLSKWPLGPVLRRCGAFFLRRSFKGETVFPPVFDAYVRHILYERHALIFFLEGGRSRTGKLLHPKMGMLHMVVDAWRRGVVEDLPMVPVTIDYGKVFEGDAFVREKGGLDKQKENLRSVLRSRKVLRNKHGVLRLRVGDPIYLTDFFKSHGVTRETLTQEEKGPLMNQMGFQLLAAINDKVTLTAGNLVAGLLMGNPRRGMTMEDLRRLFVMTTSFLRKRAEITFTDQKLEVGLENALKTFEKSESLVRVEVGGRVVINIPENKRSEMDYYKNNGLHFVLDLSLLCMGFLSLPPEERTLANIGSFAREVYALLHQEFVFGADFPSDEALASALEAMTRIDALRLDGDHLDWGAYRIGHDLVKVTGFMLLNFLESYFVVAEALYELDGNPDRKQFLKQCLLKSRLFYAVGIQRRLESVNHVSFSNALTRFSKLGFVIQESVKGQRYPRIVPVAEKREEFGTLKDKIFKWMQDLRQ